MKAKALVFLLGTASLFQGGCNDAQTVKKAPADTLGVVDLDQVAEKMGWKEEMKKNLTQTESSVKEDLQSYLNYRNDELKRKKAEIIKAHALLSTELDKPHTRDELKALGLTDAQVEEYAGAVALVNNEQAKANQTLEQIIQKQNSEIIRAYQSAAQPSIRRVAKSSGRDVVMQQQSTVYIDPQLDLTNQVVEDLQHTTNGTTVTLPPIPKIEFNNPDKEKK